MSLAAQAFTAVWIVLALEIVLAGIAWVNRGLIRDFGHREPSTTPLQDMVSINLGLFGVCVIGAAVFGLVVFAVWTVRLVA